jgi:hypothetical protein
LVAGDSGGVTLLTPDGKGSFVSRRLRAMDSTLESSRTRQSLDLAPDQAKVSATSATGAEALGPGGVCAVGDFNDDGAADIVQVFAHGLVVYAGSPEPAVFAEPVTTQMEIAKHPTAVVCGDYDTDGQLDLMVGGIGGTTLLTRGEGGAWLNVIAETGELGASSGLGQGENIVVAACASDINGDGRQCATLFHAASSPGPFFSRGFACFGIARSLDFSESRLPAAEALGSGQMTGVLCDLNGDLTPDLLAVDRQQGVWGIFGAEERSRRFQPLCRWQIPRMDR